MWGLCNHETLIHGYLVLQYRSIRLHNTWQGCWLGRDSEETVGKVLWPSREIGAVPPREEIVRTFIIIVYLYLATINPTIASLFSQYFIYYYHVLFYIIRMVILISSTTLWFACPYSRLTRRYRNFVQRGGWIIFSLVISNKKNFFFVLFKLALNRHSL